MSTIEFIRDDVSTRKAGLICLVGLGGFLLFAGTVPLAEGVAVPGQVVAESNRKTVQHLEGGIVRRLHVREGTAVKAGDVLLQLEDVASRSQRDQLALKVAQLRASRDRLQALGSMQASIAFAAIDDLAVDGAAIAQIHGQQRALFSQQRLALGSDLSVLGSRRRSLGGDASGKARQIGATQRALELVRRNLSERRKMLSEQLIRRDSVDELEREERRLEIELARLSTERTGSLGQASEVGEQIGKSRADFLEDVSAELTTARAELAAAEEELRAAEDVLERTVIRAPQAGKVLNLAFNTVGGVVRPGEAIMEIVPGSASLIAHVRISPNARDAVQVGQSVVARLNINKSWNAPQLEGRVLDVSGDLKKEPETGASFFEARLLLTAPPELRKTVTVTPGMPIEASINSGVRRTFLSYLLEPIRMTIIRGLG